MKKQQQGFTLIEVMIATAIIGILGSIAIPSYSAYTKKAKFTEVITAIAPVKMSLDTCASVEGVWKSSQCSYNTFNASQYIQEGKITFIDEQTVSTEYTLMSGNGFKGETYNLTGSIKDFGIEWKVDPNSTCLKAGICRI